MLFNSITFLLFFSAVYVLYLVLQHRWQNRLLLLASLVFYGWWDPRFLGLILFSIGLDYVCGLQLHRADTPQRRRLWLGLSLAGNLGLLGFFKYFHFFIDSFIALAGAVGLQAHAPTLNIILPIGISFYTFQTLSYTLDIYYRRMKPTTNFTDFALFVSFFPQLLAGPIERARNLLPQIESPRTITVEHLRAGLYLIGWGVFKKMLLADNFAPIANYFFAHSSEASAADVVLGVTAFALQLYCDFSAYADMARGLGRLLGFQIMQNFRFPEFSSRLSDFWSRWHISLSTWIRDYMFLPLGANRRGNVRTALNVMLVMTAIGLWHGADWTFVLWGAYLGALQAGHLLLLNVLPRRRVRQGYIGVLIHIRNILMCRAALLSSLILFRSADLGQVLEMVQGLGRGFHVLEDFFPMLRWFIVLWLPFRLYDFWGYLHDDEMAILKQKGWIQFAALLFLMIWGYVIYTLAGRMPVTEEFIYFQF